MCPIKLKPTMKSTHSVECKLVVAKTVVHFLLIVKNLFTIQKKLAIDFVTVIYLVWQKFAHNTLNYAPLFQHYALCFSSRIMPKSMLA